MPASEFEKPSARVPVERTRRVGLDILAWVSFAVGLIGMFWVVGLALTGEGDGSFRTRTQIQQQVRMLFGCGAWAAGIPALVWMLQSWLDSRDRWKVPDDLFD